MNVLQNLTELYNQLPLDSTYREVAKGILTNLEESSDATIYDVAELTNSSRTTVWRMVQKMGYENYSDFRHALKQAVVNYSYFNRIIPEKEVREEEKLVANLQDQLVQTSTIMGELIQTQGLLEMSERIADVKKVVFYFSYHSSAISSFQQNLAMDKKETAMFCLLPEMLENAETLDEDSIVFMSLVEHAETLDMTKLFTSIKKQNAKIYMFGGEKSHYEKYVDERILEDKQGHTIISDLVLVDMYFIALSEMYRKHYVEKDK